MAKRTTKNRVLSAIVGAKAAGKNYITKYSRLPKRKLIDNPKIKRSIASKLPGEGTMGLRNLNTATKMVKKLVGEGKPGKARAYVKDQLRKIAEQGKGTDVESEAKRRARTIK